MLFVLHERNFKPVHKAMGNSAISTTQHEWLIDSVYAHCQHNLGILTELNAASAF